MEQLWRTTGEALTVLDAVMSSIDHAARGKLSAPERLVLMKRARSFEDRAVSLACVLTDEASCSSVAATGTPITSLIGLDEGRDSGDAARQVFQSRDLARYAAVKEAALAGTVSSRHAAAISKGMAQLPSGLTTEQKLRAEQAFLDKASRNTPRRLVELAPQVLAEVAPELVPSGEDEAARLERQRRRASSKRSLRWGDDGDGSTWLHGSLPHLEAAPLISLVEAYVESDHRAARDRFKATRATDPGPKVMRDQAGEDINRTPEQRRADALTHIISDHRDAPSSVGDRPRIVVTIREDDLRERAEQAGVLAKGAKITAGDLRRLCCDADLMPVVLGGPSEILDVGRTQRLVTPAIRKALTLRDGGCVFPHCTASDSACEAHHLQPWWAGGATALWNLVLLCPHHHKLVEPDRWSRPGDRWVIHIDPDTSRVVVVPPARTDRFMARAGPPSSSAGTSPSESAASAGLRRMAEPGAPPLIHSLA